MPKRAYESLSHARGSAGLLLTNYKHTSNQPFHAPYIRPSTHPYIHPYMPTIHRPLTYTYIPNTLSSTHPNIHSSTHPNNPLIYASGRPPMYSRRPCMLHSRFRFAQAINIAANDRNLQSTETKYNHKCITTRYAIDR